MAKLESITGGRPGRPGNMITGKAPRPPRPAVPPKPVNQKKSTVKKRDQGVSGRADLERDDSPC